MKHARRADPSSTRESSGSTPSATNEAPSSRTHPIFVERMDLMLGGPLSSDPWTPPRPSTGPPLSALSDDFGHVPSSSRETEGLMLRVVAAANKLTTMLK